MTIENTQFNWTCFFVYFQCFNLLIFNWAHRSIKRFRWGIFSSSNVKAFKLTKLPWASTVGNYKRLILFFFDLEWTLFNFLWFLFIRTLFEEWMTLWQVYKMLWQAAFFVIGNSFRRRRGNTWRVRLSTRVNSMCDLIKIIHLILHLLGHNWPWSNSLGDNLLPWSSSRTLSIINLHMSCCKYWSRIKHWFYRTWPFHTLIDHIFLRFVVF